MAEQQEPFTPVDKLQRWESFGATWRVLAHDAGTVTLSLRRCDGGEEVERMTSADADLLAYVGERRSSDE